MDTDRLGCSKPDGPSEPIVGRLRIALVVAGFPTREDPYSGVFNMRALRALASVGHVTVLFLRAWVPGRPWRRVSETALAKIVTVAVPQLPTQWRWGSSAMLVNILVYRILGWSAVRDVLADSDVIHSVDVIVGMVAGYWAARIHKHHVAQAIGSDVNTVVPHMSSLISKGWTRQLHGVACNSGDLKRRFSLLYPHVPNVRTVHRGVDTDLFEPTGIEVGPQAQRSPVRFAYFGGFRRDAFPRRGSDIKGGFTVLSAWKEAEPELPSSASLLLAGPDADEAVIGEWKQSLRYPGRVHVVGRVSPNEMPGYLRAADVVLVPSLEEGLPNVCVETAACGRVVFGSATGGIPEIVQDGETGLILPRDDVKAWCRGLVESSNRPDKLRKMGQHARLRAVGMFNARDYAPKMLNLYQAALRLPLIPEPGRCR